MNLAAIEDSSIKLMWALALAACGGLVVIVWFQAFFSGPTSKEKLCTSFHNSEGIFHSSRPFQARSDALIVAYRGKSRSGSALHYGGCVFKNGTVDAAQSSVMFDELAHERQEQCLNAHVSLAPRKLWGYKRAAEYGSRLPTEEEVERRRGRCTFEAGKQDVIDDLKWRRFG